MAALQEMTLKQGVDAVGAYLASVAPSAWNRASYPAPDINIPDPGKPTLVVRYEGADDDGGGLRGVLLPRRLLFEVRIYHPSYGPPEEAISDGFAYAQEKCLEGADAFTRAVYADPTLGGLVLDTLIAQAAAGEMADADGNIFYGHDMAVLVEVH